MKLTVRLKKSRDFYINYFKKGYQPRTNTVKDEKDDLFADSHSILSRFRNHFSKLLNKFCVNVVRQTDTHSRTTRAWPSAFEVQLAIEQLKRHKSPSIDHISKELINL